MSIDESEKKYNKKKPMYCTHPKGFQCLYRFPWNSSDGCPTCIFNKDAKLGNNFQIYTLEENES